MTAIFHKEPIVHEEMDEEPIASEKINIEGYALIGKITLQKQQQALVIQKLETRLKTITETNQQLHDEQEKTNKQVVDKDVQLTEEIKMREALTEEFKTELEKKESEIEQLEKEIHSARSSYERGTRDTEKKFKQYMKKMSDTIDACSEMTQEELKCLYHCVAEKHPRVQGCASNIRKITKILYKNPMLVMTCMEEYHKRIQKCREARQQLNDARRHSNNEAVVHVEELS